jgi:TonB family protein
VLLDKLESGCLLFETQWGLVRAELSLGQRLYLLWTFRHFRQLSAKLLNSRQQGLVNTLFGHNSGVIEGLDDQLPVIGIVENFVPQPAPVHFSPASASNNKLQKREWRERLVPLTKIVSKLKAPSLRLQKSWSRIAASRVDWSVVATSKITAAIGWVGLCIMLVMAWRRIERLPSSQAYNQPRIQQASAVTEIKSARPVQAKIVSQTSTALAPSAVGTPALSAPKTAIKSASNAALVRGSVRTAKPGKHVHDLDTPAKLQVSEQESAIEASRAPLHCVYPDHVNVRSRSVVSLVARVDSDGKVRSVRIVSGKRPLAAAAVRAVRQWRYSPYLSNGEAVATETNIVISFIAHDAISMSFPQNIPASR